MQNPTVLLSSVGGKSFRSKKVDKKGIGKPHSLMGKQVQFYMTHEDEKNFLASISDLAPVRLIYKTFTEPLHMELESFAPVGHSGGNFHPNYCQNAYLCLVNATLGTVPKVNSSPQH